VGLRPARILATSDSRLRAVLRESRSGMMPEKRAQRIKEVAARAEMHYAGNLEKALAGTPAEARKVLKQFPTVGDSGADRILLFGAVSPVAAIPANGVRVPLRIAFGEEKRNYAASYRAAHEYVRAELPEEFAARQRAYLLLKIHGEKVCRTKPACEECVLTDDCLYFQQRRRQ
jgi:endonuclease III